MAVASIKVCWYKFSARIRDYLDAADSYSRATTEGSNNAGTGRQHHHSSSPRNRHHYSHNNHHHHHLHHHQNDHSLNVYDVPDMADGSLVAEGEESSRHRYLKSYHNSLKQIQATKGTVSFVHGHHHRHNVACRRGVAPSSERKVKAHDDTVLRSPDHSQPSHNQHRHHQHNLLLTRSQLPPGYSKRKTSQGQVFFVDQNGHKSWYDPSVPRELLTASLDLDLLVGSLSATWEVRQTPTGKTYFVNHIKRTTQFTDPRLVAYKDQLLEFVRQQQQESPQQQQQQQEEQQQQSPQPQSQQPLPQQQSPPEQQVTDEGQPRAPGPTPAPASAPADSTPASANRDGDTLPGGLASSSPPPPPPPPPPPLPQSTTAPQQASHPPPPCIVHGGCTQLASVHQANQQQQQQLLQRSNQDLFDKISILRQELLKQQVILHPCRIDIHRRRVFEESFRIISQMHPRDLKKRLLVKFRGEEGLDYGGVAREWFHVLSREILNPIHGLFQYTSEDNYDLQINPDSGIVYREHLLYMNFCGRIIGMAVFHGHFVEGHFTLPLYKMLLGKPINLSDIEFMDPDLHRSLCWILENDITNVIDTTFMVQHNAFGKLQEYELKANGRNTTVTEHNKAEYVSLYVNHRCRRGIEPQLVALQRGFHELISPQLIENFNERDLELLIGGLSKIDIDDWSSHTKLKNCTPETPLVRWFWAVVRSYSEHKRARLLQFVTGSPRVPIQGFKALQGVNSELRLFTIHLIKNASTDNLPKSHTCFNRIDLPPYETYERLRDKLTQAIEETMGFAMQ